MRTLSLMLAATLILSGGAQAPSALAECLNICGDFNSSGTVTSADVITLFHLVGWVYYGGGRECGDVDGYLGVGIRDLERMVNFVFHDGAPLTCPPESSSYMSVTNGDVRLRFTNIFPRGLSSARVQVNVLAARPTKHVSLAFRVQVDGQPAVVEPFATPSSNLLTNSSFSSQTVVTDQWHQSGQDKVTGCFSYYGQADLPPGDYPLLFFDVLMPPSPWYRTITLELLGLPDSITNVPMMVDSAMVGWSLSPEGYVVDPPGDVNQDRAVTSSDIIAAINYCFKGGAWPVPHIAAADPNCSESVTSADVIFLVNYVFMSGPAPCNINTECTLLLDGYTWTCP